METELSVCNALITAILDSLPLSEQEKLRLLERSGLAMAALRDVNGRTSHAAYARFFTQARRATRDDFLGLYLGRSIPGSRFGLAPYTAQNSRDLREVLTRLCKYARLINELNVCSLEESEGTARFIMSQRQNALDMERHGVDIAFVCVVVFARQQLGTKFELREVRLRHTLKFSLDRYEEIFQAPITFGCQRSELVFAASALDAALPFSDPLLGSILERYASTELSAIPEAMKLDLISKISQILLCGLRSGKKVALPQICAELKLPVRQLQRRLREAGTTFSTLLDNVRRSLSPTLLMDPAANVEQVGFQLGYSEPTAFIRAFKKWYDMTPGEYRKRRS